jgi:hypothetical protein
VTVLGDVFDRCFIGVLVAGCLAGWVVAPGKLLLDGFRARFDLFACRESWIPSGTWEPETSDREQDGSTIGKALCDQLLAPVA